jgi:tetratricopeptide (TPR) repeat protein
MISGNMPTLSPTRSIENELSHIRRLSKDGRHLEALAAAQALFAAVPQNRHALYLIATNQRCLNRIDEALITSRRLEAEHPQFSLLYQERGYCYLSLRDGRSAIAAFLHAVQINPALVASWSMLERLYRQLGDQKNAGIAADRVSALKRLAPEVLRAGSLFSDGELSAAENILRAYLPRAGEDFEALRLLARIDQRCGSLEEAERLLESTVKLAPSYIAGRVDYVRVLLDRQKFLKARQEVETLLATEPDHVEYLSLQAAACAGLGDHKQAITLYRQLVGMSPASADQYLMLGHSLQAVGLQQEAAETFAKAAHRKPGFGDAWWSRANLKTYRFSESEIAQMCLEESSSAARPLDRIHLCFALGKAYEDRRNYEESWQFYLRGNTLKREQCPYNPEFTESVVGRQIAVCTTQFFAVRSGFGVTDPDPIFIVGLPRSGSTLLEQILASHSQVEGTQELPHIQRMVKDMEGEPASSDDPSLDSTVEDAYPEQLTKLTSQDFRRLGEQYIEETRAYRSGKQYFLDKMPNNFHHIGLIHLMTPNAKIIDVRREPMACCFSNLKQLFAGGQEFTYGIEDVAHHYRIYLKLMRHWDAVLPGRVLRVHYEDIVEDLEGSVRQILEFCGLSFESACVEFYKTDRTICTPSSEQVRQPIFREALSQWRNYEPWLGQLKDSLGDALINYRN